MAWSDSDSARRAARAALPFFGKAQEVVVLINAAIDYPEEDGPTVFLEGLHIRGIRAKLARMHEFWGSTDIDNVTRHSPDLIVAEASVLRSRWVFPSRREKQLHSLRSLLLINS